MVVDLRRQKQALRETMRLRRAAAQIEAPDAGQALRDCFLRHVSLPSNAIVGGYYAFGSEIDPMPLMESLLALKHNLALPVVVGRGKPLVFRRFNPGDQLLQSGFGVMEPLPSAPEVDPDILLMPLLAFDRHRYRLGYGGGFYDRTIVDLQRRKALQTVGVAFACQEVAEIPRGRYDAQLDKIVAEHRVF